MVEVSVLTPSFGYGRFLRDTLESVRGQHHVQVEHIIQDGGSTDDTLEVLESAGESINWHSEPDQGQSDALNKAYSHAAGHWIAWLNADEFYLPGALDHLVRVGHESGADMVYGDCLLVGPDGRLLRLLPQHRFSEFVLRWYGPFIASCTTLFRRSALGDKPWDETVDRILDWDLYLRLLAERMKFVYTPFPVGAFRVHPDRITALPLAEFASSHAIVRRRYSLPPGGDWLRRGRLVHGFLKVLDGSYRRQMAVRHLRDADMRWFKGTLERKAVASLFAHAYKRAMSNNANIREPEDPS